MHEIVGALVILIALGFFGILATLLAFFPQRVVSMVAREQRGLYKDRLHMSDEDIDKLAPLYKSKVLDGPRSRFINHAPEHPEDFSCSVDSLRLFGIVMWCLLIFMAISMISDLVHHTLVILP